eukprot:45928_1
MEKRLDDDNDFKMANYTHKETKRNSPIIRNLDWLENGKISISFAYHPSYKHKIETFEIYYCYVNHNDKKWYQYAQNNWKSISITSSQINNKNVELRIATHKHIYDESKNTNIELLV